MKIFLSNLILFGVVIKDSIDKEIKAKELYITIKSFE